MASGIACFIIVFVLINGPTLGIHILMQITALGAGHHTIGFIGMFLLPDITPPLAQRLRLGTRQLTGSYALPDAL
jgi:hypothetical protein